MCRELSRFYKVGHAPESGDTVPVVRCPGQSFWRGTCSGRKDDDLPLDVRDDMRSMDAGGTPRAGIARRLNFSRNIVAKCVDMKDLSPEPPLPEERPRTALEEREAWTDAVLEADLGVAHKQCHTAKRLFDRLVGERDYEWSYSTVQRRVRGCRLVGVSVVSEEHVAEVALVDAAVSLSSTWVCGAFASQTTPSRRPISSSAMRLSVPTTRTV